MMFYAQANRESQLAEMGLELERKFNWNNIIEVGIQGAVQSWSSARFGATSITTAEISTFTGTFTETITTIRNFPLPTSPYKWGEKP